MMMLTASRFRTLLAGTALATLVALGAPPNAAAQDSAGLQPDQMRASQMMGDGVYNAGDQEIGQVVDLILDPSGQVAGLIVHLVPIAGVGEKTIAVPTGDFRAKNDHLTLDRSKDQLQQAANVPGAGGGASGPGGQMRASQMIGHDVYNTSDQDIGQVVDLVVDPTGQVAGVIVHLVPAAGVGDKNVTVPMRDISTQKNHLTVDRSKDQLQQAQNYKLDGSAGSSTPPSAQGSQNPSAGGSSGSSTSPSSQGNQNPSAGAGGGSGGGPTTPTQGGQPGQGNPSGKQQ